MHKVFLEDVILAADIYVGDNTGNNSKLYALVIHKYFGGSILRGISSDEPVVHYFNSTPLGVIDATGRVAEFSQIEKVSVGHVQERTPGYQEFIKKVEDRLACGPFC